MGLGIHLSVPPVAFSLCSEVPPHQKVLQVIKYFPRGLQYLLACACSSKMISVLKAHRASAEAKDGSGAPSRHV